MSGTRALLLRPERCIDGDGRKLPPGTELLVSGEIIAEVGPGIVHPSAEVVDLAGLTLLPGFVDLHDYLSVEPDRPDPMRRIHDPNLSARRTTAIRNLRRDAAAGVTTLRVMGEGLGLDVELRDAGRGSRLLVSGAPIAAPGTHQAGPDGGCATPDDVARAVDARAAMSVDWIKLVATGGALGGHVGPTESPWSREHLNAAMRRAEAHRLPVAVAAHGGPIVTAAADAGAATLEHAAWLDETGLTAIAANGMAVVATLGRLLRADGMAQGAAGGGRAHAMLVEVTANLRRWVPQALRRGVRLGLGGDNMHGRQAWDAVELVRLGASPEGAVAALTGRGAEIAQRTDRGMFKPGKLADCVAIEGDPLRDPDALLRPRFVLCRGVITSLLPAISMAMEEAA